MFPNHTYLGTTLTLPSPPTRLICEPLLGITLPWSLIERNWHGDLGFRVGLTWLVILVLLFTLGTSVSSVVYQFSMK